MPRLAPFQASLDELLEEDEARPRREKLRMTRVHDLLVREGFNGSYDAVRRYAAGWRLKRRRGVADAPSFIPLMFQPGEAYQFDWSHEDVEIAGKPMRVKVAHMRLCASRAIYVRAYPRETQEMLFDMKTAVTTVFTGKDRVFNRRFLVEADQAGPRHRVLALVEAVERAQHGLQRRTFGCQGLGDRQLGMLAQLAPTTAFRLQPAVELLQAGEAQARLEEPSLCRLDLVLDLALLPARRWRTGRRLDHIVARHDRNRYSVMAKAGRRTVQVRAYADRIVVRYEGEVVADHRRFFGRDRTLYDPWHYLPVLATKPEACAMARPSRTGSYRRRRRACAASWAQATRPIAGSCGGWRRCWKTAWSRSRPLRARRSLPGP